MSFQIGNISFGDLSLECLHCEKNTANVKEGEIIHVCHNCMEHTAWTMKNNLFLSIE